MLLYLVLGFEVLTFFVSIMLYLKRNVDLYLRFFPIFLFITVVVEGVGFKLREKGINSWPMYNFFYVFEFVFYFFVLNLVIQNTLVKNAILFVSTLYPIAAIIYNLSQDMYVFNSLIYNIGALAVVCFSAYYFYEIFKIPLIRNLFKEPPFWISIGLLTYYSCTGPFFVVFKYIDRNGELEWKVYTQILTITNVLLYSSFMMAFVCF